MLLFALSINTLLSVIQCDPLVSGYSLPRSVLCKFVAHADDVTFFVKDAGTLLRILQHFSFFYRASGAKIHTSSVLHLRGTFPIPQSLDIPVKPLVRILGVFFGKNAHIRNTEALYLKVGQKTTLWSDSYDYYSSRIAVFKSILFGTCNYYGSVYTQDRHFNNTNSLMFRYVWVRKCEWVSRVLMYKSRASGGWGMFDPPIFSVAAQIKQLVCAITLRDHPVKHLYRFFLGYCTGLIDPTYQANLEHKCFAPPPFVKTWCSRLRSLGASLNPSLRVSEIYRLLRPDVPFSPSPVATSAVFSLSTVWGRCFDSMVPEPCTHLQWQILHRALPTRYKLSLVRARPYPNCGLCDSAPETIAHLFYCPVARKLWGWIARLLGIPFLSCENIVLHVLFPDGNTTAYVVNLVIHLSKRKLWLTQCRQVFEGRKTYHKLLRTKFREALAIKLLSDFKTLRRSNFLSLWDTPAQTLWAWRGPVPLSASSVFFAPHHI